MNILFKVGGFRELIFKIVMFFCGVWVINLILQLIFPSFNVVPDSIIYTEFALFNLYGIVLILIYLYGLTHKK